MSSGGGSASSGGRRRRARASVRRAVKSLHHGLRCRRASAYALPSTRSCSILPSGSRYTVKMRVVPPAEGDAEGAEGHAAAEGGVADGDGADGAERGEAGLVVRQSGGVEVVLQSAVKSERSMSPFCRPATMACRCGTKAVAVRVGASGAGVEAVVSERRRVAISLAICEAAPEASWLVRTAMAMWSSGKRMFSATKPPTSPECSMTWWPS